MHSKILEIHERATTHADGADSKAICFYILDSLKDIRTVAESASKLFEEALSQQHSELARDSKSLKGHRDEVESQKQASMHVNTGTFNMAIQVLIQCFQSEIQLNKILNPQLTTKEMKDLQKKQKSQFFQRDFEQKTASLQQALHVFQKMKDTAGKVRGVRPDNFTCSQLLKGLKILSVSQAFSASNHYQLQWV